MKHFFQCIFMWRPGKFFCPGDPFYETERNVRTFRINYSNSSDEVIDKGVRILAVACEELLAK